MASKRCQECGKPVPNRLPRIGKPLPALCRTCAERQWYPEGHGPFTGGLLKRPR